MKKIIVDLDIKEAVALLSACNQSIIATEKLPESLHSMKIEEIERFNQIKSKIKQAIVASCSEVYHESQNRICE